MIYFCRWPAIISKSSEWSIFYIIKVSQPKVHHGSVTIKGAAGEFLRRGFEFYRGCLVWPIYLNLHRHLTETDFSLKGRRGRLNHMKPPLEPPKGCHTKKYCQGVTQTKVTDTNRGIVRDYQKQKYCQGVKQSKVLPGSATI